MKLHSNHNPVLVLAPHTDDGEIGCGGYIAKAIEEGFEVYYVAFSNAQVSLPPDSPKDILVREVKEATTVLGIPAENLQVLEYPTRRFAEHRQEILDTMIRLREEIAPQLIFAPSLHDVHQDHKTIAEEAVRAFKTQSLLSYEEPWNNITFSTHCFVELEERHVQKKVEALRCYKSQSHRKYVNEDSIRAIITTRGLQLQVEHAEAFEVIRWML